LTCQRVRVRTTGASPSCCGADLILNPLKRQTVYGFDQDPDDLKERVKQD